MDPAITLQSILIPSEDIVAREIEGELVIVPLTSGIGDMEDEIYVLNPTAKEVWIRLGHDKTLAELINDLCVDYDVDKMTISTDILGVVNELYIRKIVILQ